MKYASILAVAAATAFIVSCENKKNEEGTTPPGQENSMQAKEARFAADMAGVPIGKYVPVNEAQKANPGQTVNVKGQIFRKSVPAAGQDNVLLIVDPEKIKTQIVDGKRKAASDVSPDVILDNTIIAILPEKEGDPVLFEELDEVIITGTMQAPESDKEEPFKTIKVNSIAKQPKAEAK